LQRVETSHRIFTITLLTAIPQTTTAGRKTHPNRSKFRRRYMTPVTENLTLGAEVFFLNMASMDLEANATPFLFEPLPAFAPPLAPDALFAASIDDEDDEEEEDEDEDDEDLDDEDLDEEDDFDEDDEDEDEDEDEPEYDDDDEDEDEDEDEEE
jgi:hypothetical protein